MSGIHDYTCVREDSGVPHPMTAMFSRLSGLEATGSESFNFGAASYQGEPRKGMFEKCGAVSTNGNAMVFDCLNDD